jgi:hypothetical protein
MSQYGATKEAVESLIAHLDSQGKFTMLIHDYRII